MSPTYDRVFIGGGIASLFAAYHTLSALAESGLSKKILVLTEKIKAPMPAGSHWVPQMEGLASLDLSMHEGVRQNLRDARTELTALIEKESISCRFAPGYEIKAKSREALDSFYEAGTSGGTFLADDASGNSDAQIFRLPGHDYSLSVSTIGQINAPLFISAIVASIEKMGGEVVTGEIYRRHTTDADGIVSIFTANGVFKSRTVPFLGTGALHHASMPDFDILHRISYTGGLVIGPLSDQDARQISKSAIAFCDINVHDDVLWGSVDPENMLVIGKGDLDSLDHKSVLMAALKDIAESILPGVTQKYPYSFTCDAIMTPHNSLPVIGRRDLYDIAGGWTGLGIVASFAAGRAFADWYVHGDDRSLNQFESMQPGKFLENPKRLSRP